MGRKNRAKPPKQRRGRKGRQPGLSPKCMAVLPQLVELRDLASDHGLTVRCNEMGKRHRPTLHMIFDAVDGPVLHYWPNNGTTWAPRGGKKGKAADVWEALDEAARLGAESYAGSATCEADAHLAAIAGRYDESVVE